MAAYIEYGKANMGKALEDLWLLRRFEFLKFLTSCITENHNDLEEVKKAKSCHQSAIERIANYAE